MRGYAASPARNESRIVLATSPFPANPMNRQMPTGDYGVTRQPWRRRSGRSDEHRERMLDRARVGHLSSSVRTLRPTPPTREGHPVDPRSRLSPVWMGYPVRHTQTSTTTTAAGGRQQSARLSP